ncbi:hypothetical protein [Microvirga mediterraneensis]|uniref:Uncharacterized protein n=1 Tax=Microvirga mediterraneensis TaxID=2754695 RepID=A0A838BJY8_9HYPH|nr:hypothetical protein [Microvirga mediterraneensis]MBA1155022.1 hypothetical protein [Microvirga mediterraneensis]
MRYANLALTKDFSLIPSADRHTLDTFHSELLWANSFEDNLHGVLSVVYWGNYAGSDPKKGPNGFALARTKWMVDGKSGRPKPSMSTLEIAIRNGRTHLKEGRLDQALKALMDIPYLGMSFASKVLMFLDPRQAVIYDSKIGEKITRLAQLDSTWGSRVVNVGLGYTRSKGNAYTSWCKFCIDKAAELNAKGATWSEAKGVRRDWRAVDVERSIFALN